MNTYTPWEQIALSIINKIFMAVVGFIVFAIVANFLIDSCSGKKPTQAGGNVWKNLDPSRSVQDIKSYDYNNQTVTYREYRNSASPITSPDKPYSWKEVEHRTVLYTYPNPSNKKTGVTVKNGNMTVTIDLEKIFENMPDYQKEQFLQDIMDNVDYNDLLDYYGSPELR